MIDYWFLINIQSCLCGKYCKRLDAIPAVQTLSRLNRTHPLKEDTFVVDLVNDKLKSIAAWAVPSSKPSPTKSQVAAPRFAIK
jgi:hypothetical protein